MVYEYLTILLAFVSAILGILLLLEKKERKKESGKHADYKKRRNRGQRGKIKGEYTEILLRVTCFQQVKQLFEEVGGPEVVSDRSGI